MHVCRSACAYEYLHVHSCHGPYAHIFLQVPVDRPLGTFLSGQCPLFCKCFEGDLTGSAPSSLSSGHIAHKRNGLRGEWDESFHSGTASGNSNTSPTPSQLPLSNMSCSSPVGKVSVSVCLVSCSHCVWPGPLHTDVQLHQEVRCCSYSSTES